jgi:hypothetical protein
VEFGGDFRITLPKISAIGYRRLTKDLVGSFQRSMFPSRGFSFRLQAVQIAAYHASGP